MQQGLAAALLYQVKGLASGVHCSSKLLVAQQADGAAHGGMQQVLGAQGVQVAQLGVRLRAMPGFMQGCTEQVAGQPFAATHS